MSDETEISALLRAAAGASGLAPRDHWEDQAARALRAIAEQRGATVSALLRDPEGRPSLVSELLDHLTIGETYFFRHASHFDVLLEALSARLADPLATACVLSAGCATGEEPYSVAIAIHARLGAQALARVRIVAADISAASIRKARAAVYGAWAFRDAPAWLEPRYFARGAGPGRRLVDVIRRAVTFEVGHVVHHAAGLPSGSVDAVLFRNVAIYLAPQAIADAYAEFHRALGPHGLLFVAPADPRPDGARFVEAGHETTSVYRPRAAAAEPHAEPAPPSRRARLAARLRRDARLLKKGPPPASSKRPAARAAAPAPRAAAPAPRAAAPALDARAAAARAAALADRGDLAAAVAATAALIEQPATAPAGYLLRAQVSMAGDRAGAAVEDLRRALFLRPEHLLARYWYVLALRGDGQLAQAIQQARVLEELLTKSAAEARLEDGETTARELLDALRLLRGGFT
ncbi:CheR family methyltransferase [Sorangium sp. So ce131]|uniref:CheR family methyltransferase n=1 Tax=Sorangium sp. So ce131 TaxID=3133282 RepID=UPI003F62C476